MIKNVESSAGTINNFSTAFQDVSVNVVKVDFANDKSIKIMFDDEGNQIKVDEKGNLFS